MMKILTMIIHLQLEFTLQPNTPHITSMIVMNAIKIHIQLALEAVLHQLQQTVARPMLKHSTMMLKPKTPF